jgi:predicted hydrocarbon binding protein
VESANRIAGREKLAGGKMKGGIFRSHAAWLLEHEPGRAADVWSRLPEDARRELSRTILVSSWYPFEWLVALDGAIEEVFGREYPEILRELGRYSARINLSTTYRVFDRGDNHEFFRNSALLHRQFQDFGDVAYEKTGDTSGAMIHTNYPCYSLTFCRSALGYYEQCLVNHGGRNPVVRETECQARGNSCCRFELEWSA